MKITVSKQEEKKQIIMEKPHVVILGAGASLAAFPKGEKNDLLLPLMNNFIKTLKLQDILDQTTIRLSSNNFEEFYSELHQNNQYNELRGDVERRIDKYFRQFRISDSPTLYDHLLLSLRKKDCIATFNWDPLIVQAYQRNKSKFELPELLFLHGNVEIGYCKKDKEVGLRGSICSRCREKFQPTTLLYPIKEKNYDHNGFISLQWGWLRHHIKDAFMITVFGYGAPQSDVSAIQLMENAWGRIQNRNMEQTEVIDIKPEQELRKTWQMFIHTHHYEVHRDFYSSWIANHPRRTGEAYYNQYFGPKFIENNPIPRDIPFNDLWNWLKPYQEIERKSKQP